MQTPTVLKYMDHPHLYEDIAKVVNITHQDDRTIVHLDQTIFYPQGGGQPYDLGTIKGKNGTFAVEEVRFADGLVHHIGTMEGALESGEEVSLTVDAARRQLNTRLHSAGHLIDEAVNKLGYKWQATKGCHFPGQCSVEYEGELEEGVDYVAALKQAFDDMVANGFAVKQEFVPAEELESVCHFVLPNMPTDKPSRVATLWGDKGVPCGGTHVANLNEIGPITIRKVKAKKGKIKVSYEL